MERESIRVTRSVSLDPARSSSGSRARAGPGGQHAQKSETRVEAVFDVEASPSLTERQKRRVVARAGPVLRAVAQDERSQARNRELAVERLVEKLARRAPRRAAPCPDRPDGGVPEAPARGEAPPRRRQAKPRDTVRRVSLC